MRWCRLAGRVGLQCGRAAGLSGWQVYLVRVGQGRKGGERELVGPDGSMGPRQARFFSFSLLFLILFSN